MLRQIVLWSKVQQKRFSFASREVVKLNILFLTLIDVCDIQQPGIYQDLIREFVKKGHCVTIVSPSERRTGQATRMIEGDCRILKVKIGNIQKTNLIEKGVSTVLIEAQLKAAIKRHLSDVKFDLVIYSTPPITFANVVKYVKKRDGAKSYLLLKDIFPQNAVDMGMMSKSGPKSLIYWAFRKKEKALYRLSDRIGCMSQANVDFVIRHNSKVKPDIVEVCPNSIEVRDMTLDEEERAQLRQKYGIPADKRVFVYGGNLGRPQGIPFLIECLRSQKERTDVYFLIVGDGTEYGVLARFMEEEMPKNVKLLKRLPKEDYDRMIAACDVGMIFLDYRFTIPNFPSRLLAYMQAKLPVLCCTDPNTDVGDVVEKGGFGWKCMSNDVADFCQTVDTALNADLEKMGQAGKKYLLEHYTVKQGYHIITKE